MKLKEKLYYKMRNYLYERERENLYKSKGKPQGETSKKEKNPNQSGQAEGILGFFDDMEEYLDEQLDKVKTGIKKK